MKGKTLRRAILTRDAVRINTNLPLITDHTELIDPEMAQEMLKRNQHNRPVNWAKVEEFSEIMKRGDWKLHPQGIILDGTGNILTGQTRLWAIVYSGRPVAMRVSRGASPDVASVIDRGRPQSARDLASRKTDKKHSPTESSMARCICVLRGNTHPSVDDIAAVLVEKSKLMTVVLTETHGTKKTRAVLMVLASICEVCEEQNKARDIAKKTSVLAEKLDMALLPHSAAKCWGKGTAFSLALQQARKLVQ